ncbi:hypothetical protein BRADI_2g45465v3 [Brachypodium distachyon]|uniref:Uncharacterized protein n=1 Tax=Brachypodium distachyon TaxID=15368 RepID=A0A2K2DE11_BRADI|nr:hypothetical protein BRADI_2g45465v3 [Brachypodium distachyon]
MVLVSWMCMWTVEPMMFQQSKGEKTLATCFCATTDETCTPKDIRLSFFHGTVNLVLTPFV